MSHAVSILLHQAVSAIRRTFLCPLGLHKRDAADGPNNFCPHCMRLLRPEAFQAYVVTLKDGSKHDVRATNMHHACSIVVYGPNRTGRIDGRTGKPLDPIVVHPSNIASVTLKD